MKKRAPKTLTRYEVTANVISLGRVKHVIAAVDQLAAKDKFSAAYPGSVTAFVSVVTLGVIALE